MPGFLEPRAQWGRSLRLRAERLALRASYDQLNTTNIRLSVGRYCDPVTSIRFVRRHGCFVRSCSYSARFFIDSASVAARRSASAFRIFLTPFTLIRRLPGRSYGGNSINSIKSRYVAAVRKYSHWKSSALSGGNWVRSSFMRLLYTARLFEALSSRLSALSTLAFSRPNGGKYTGRNYERGSKCLILFFFILFY